VVRLFALWAGCALPPETPSLSYCHLKKVISYFHTTIMIISDSTSILLLFAYFLNHPPRKMNKNTKSKGNIPLKKFIFNRKLVINTDITLVLVPHG
jgi:hypothetical protein